MPGISCNQMCLTKHRISASWHFREGKRSATGIEGKLTFTYNLRNNLRKGDMPKKKSKTHSHCTRRRNATNRLVETAGG